MKTIGEQKQRLRIVIRGAVQGVGFRPFVYRLATEMGLAGWVNNSSQGVFIEAEGNSESLQRFLFRIQSEKPSISFIQSLESSYLDLVGFQSFEVRQSDESGAKTTLIMPDIATCPECLSEIIDSTNRRYRYPFTNCTNCGPRYSIIEALPYDRANTTMKSFIMCEQCQAEYESPANRRFHAQPNACPVCGPHLELWDGVGRIMASHEEALKMACQAIREGKIVAIKGLGGFHLMVDARNTEAIMRLRHHKAREEKPFALMYPNIDMIRGDCEISEIEKRMLLSPESPIVLLARKQKSTIRISDKIAPDNPYLGIMLPYTPLHHLLLGELSFPVVATSGNRSDEPICIDEHEALSRLGGIAEIFLAHNRPIARHVDDSIVRVMAGRELVVRRARGYAPLPIYLKNSTAPILAVGAHLKNTIAISVANQVVTSQHIGDLETSQALDAFGRVIDDLSKMYDFHPRAVACDMHPDYLSTKYAQKTGLPVEAVQHHYAHILSVMAENELDAPVLGVSWDGTGYGTDGTIWGGEFLKITPDLFERVGHLRTFRLPGGEKAIVEPRRSALGLLYEIFGDKAFSMMQIASTNSFSFDELKVLEQMLLAKLNSPVTSSAGRLFDAVSALIGLRQLTRYEGQAAMALEFVLDGYNTNDSYPFEIHKAEAANIVDWEQMIREIINDIKAGVDASLISAKFHNTLAEMIVEMAKWVGEHRVVLSGGCFQNKYLTERTIARLEREGFRPYWHQRIPPNDGGIALGQIMAAMRKMPKE
jgi:hydrogenase maturation protein HypF